MSDCRQPTWGRHCCLIWLVAVLLVPVLHSCGWNPKVYVVRAGDTVHLIAWRYNLSAEELAEWNDLGNPDLIYPGQKLSLVPVPKSAKKSQPTRKSNYTKDAKFDQTRTQKWLWPVADANTSQIIEPFSWNGKKGRKGISIAGEEDSSVLATRAGTVVYTGDDISGYGNMVILQHDELLLSAYGHNKKITVKEGDWVEQSDKIAVMGRTDTNRVKLYFEIRKDSVPIDPASLLP